MAALNNEPVDRVPVGFWYHFLANPEHTQGLGQPEIVAENMAGLKRFYHDFQPDFVKIMSDGFFAYPHEALVNLTSVKTGAEIEPLGENAPWIGEQVGLVKQATEAFGNEVLLFYTIFPAPRHLEFLYSLGDANENFVKLLREDKDALRHILEVMSVIRPFRRIPLFNKKDRELADAYDKAIEQLIQSGKIKELEQTYFGEDLLRLVAQ